MRYNLIIHIYDQQIIKYADQNRHYQNYSKDEVVESYMKN